MKLRFAATIQLLVFIFMSFISSAQEESELVIQSGQRYVSHRIKSLNKYDSRVKKQQDHLLKKLNKREKRFAHKLKRNDSAAYSHYQEQSLSYDSIGKVSKTNTRKNLKNTSQIGSSAIDKVKGVQSFVESKTGLPGVSPDGQGVAEKLADLKGKLNLREHVTQLITQHTNELKNLSGGKMPGLKGIQKQVFYGKGKIGAFKDMEEEPTKTEEAAMECLQGSSGFDMHMNKSTSNGISSQSAGGDASADDLEKMGFQTKQQIQSCIGKKYGGNLGAVGHHITDGMDQWQGQVKDVTGGVKDSKHSVQNLQQTGKPSFKVNPMRSLPFCKRIEKQYGWQVTHANAVNKQPATVQPSICVGFKHTPKLVYGLGVAPALGLGESWSQLHLTFQGIVLKTYTTWKWQYGIGAYAGYERLYNSLFSENKRQNPNKDFVPSSHVHKNYSESVLIGLTKSYHLNKKYEGSVQVLYDIWWAQKGLNTPIILRFSTAKK